FPDPQSSIAPTVTLFEPTVSWTQSPVTLLLCPAPTLSSSLDPTVHISCRPTSCLASLAISSLMWFPATNEKSLHACTKNALPPLTSWRRISLVPPPRGEVEDCRELLLLWSGSP